TSFAKSITDFSDFHPEFAVAVTDGSAQARHRLDKPGVRQSDTAKLTFTHQEHLKAELKSPQGRVHLQCNTCHVPAKDGKLMEPLSYEKHCQECHSLSFADGVAPHASPGEVRTFLIATYADPRNDRPSASVGGRITRPLPLVLTPEAVQRVNQAEKHLYYTNAKIGCRQCHSVESAPQMLPPTATPTLQLLPLIAKTAIPTTWLPPAQFSHRMHRSLGCASCHSDVEQSQKTSDVLLPGIKVCRECHRADTPRIAAQQAHASTDCVTCHSYHDKSKDVDLNGPFTVKDL